MQTVERYLEFERQCRELANKLKEPNQKRTLQQMADTWMKIAADRKAQMMRESFPKPKR